MRWERLFAEIEASVHDEEAWERDALADELTDGEWAETSARDLVWGEVDLDVASVGWVGGRVVRSTPEVVVVSSGGRDTVVAWSAVAGWRGGSGRAPELGEVERRLGWTRVARTFRDEGVTVRCHLRGGSLVDGVMETVAADALALRSDVGVRWIRLAALVAVRELD
ncbi:MAG: hypothetical protein QM621_06040 [Aeromicrobium sp.]|uniref:hypothetical protein n=1 Tax=Aeromicrobium sp. TaxID=1871063 RepID=UPI0039E2AA0E